jgi:GAF domain-containing protein
VRLADTLVDDYDVIEFLHFLTDRCVELGAVDEAAVMLAAPGGQLQAVASSSERSWMLELFELQNQDGPCLDAFRTGTVVTAVDLNVEHDRWPVFVPRALSLGLRAVHSVPLRLRDRVIGALNLLRVDTGALSEADQRLLRAMSDIATIGVLQERTVNETVNLALGLRTALTSRVRIEQAKSILAERYGVSIDEAFELLRTHARSHHLRLTEVASGVADRSIRISLDR